MNKKFQNKFKYPHPKYIDVSIINMKTGHKEFPVSVFFDSVDCFESRQTVDFFKIREFFYNLLVSEDFKNVDILPSARNSDYGNGCGEIYQFCFRKRDEQKAVSFAQKIMLGVTKEEHFNPHLNQPHDFPKNIHDNLWRLAASKYCDLAKDSGEHKYLKEHYRKEMAYLRANEVVKV